MTSSKENSRRGFFQDLATGAGISLVAAPLARSAQAGGPPNILYIHSHDSGRYLQPYGYAVPTPNLRRLAGQGVLFRRAFSAAPTCSPSRAALLTGQFPHQNGMLGLAHRGFSLNDYKKHILYTLRDAGYHSVLGGLQHIAGKPDRIGYDQLLDLKSNRVADVAPRVAAFLDHGRNDRPFFLDVGFFETHREYPQPTADDDARYIQPPMPIPDTPSTRSDMAGFHASARILDQGVGQVLAALERNGLAENTLVISTTDHGLAFPNMKCNLMDSGWGVSLIMRGPSLDAGKVCDAMVSQVDLYPSICDLLQLKQPSWLEGKSFLPVLRGETSEINQEVFAEVNYHAAYEPKRAVRTQRWKYIRRYGSQTTTVLPNCDDSPSKSLWMEYGWRQKTLPREDLYDLIFDPAERRNLAAEPESAAVLKEMRGRLNAWMKRTNDPLLQGPIPLPAGARINPANGISPREPVGAVR